MKPYIGILIDSFWEAVSNRILWALLICWTLILLCVAPFGYVTERSLQVLSSDISNQKQLYERIDDAAKGKGRGSAQAVVAQMDPAFVREVQKSLDNDDIRVRSSVAAKNLNKVLTSPELYSEEAFPTAARREKLKPLIEKGPDGRTEADNEELNRKLIQLAFPLAIRDNSGERLYFGYAGVKIGTPLRFSRRAAREIVEPLALFWIIKLGMGVIAIFVAVIVTSPIIPDTFRSGSLHLLLSKPISRVLLYLSKFFGGTVFVTVNIAYFITGVFLIAGLRFDIWNAGLLYCIPLLIFVFVIFYSISGLAGLIWGNSIVCVVSCMLFWLACLSLGGAQGVMRVFVELEGQIARVSPLGEDLAIVDQKGRISVWNKEFSVWQPAIAGGERGATTFGPIFDSERKKIYFKSFTRDPFDRIVDSSRAIGIIDLNSEDNSLAETQPEPASVLDDETDSDSGADLDETESDSRIPTSAAEVRKKARWVYDGGAEIPRDCFGLKLMDNQYYAICRSGLYRLNLEKLDSIEATEKALFGLLKQLSPILGNDAFEKVSEDSFIISDRASPHPTSGQPGLVVYTPGQIEILRQVDKKFEIVQSLEVDSDDGEGPIPGRARANDNFCVLAQKGRPLQIYDAQLKLKGSVELDESKEIRQIEWQPNSNRIAILYQTGELFFVDCNTMSRGNYNLGISGDVTSIDWASPTDAWIGSGKQSVYKINLESGAVAESYNPALSSWQLAYYWGVDPVYQVLPKPSAMDEVMTYLLSGKEAQSVNAGGNNAGPTVKLSIWGPLLSNSAFIVVILTLSCIYVGRKEF
ncbi:MAG: ABC transporter permease [Planctomycetota bacterium]|nr:ABC transporter permease [Planctomycetota bacterium]